MAPAGLAPAIVQRLNTEVAGLLAEPETVERIKPVGNKPSPSSPEALRARIAADIDKWTKVVDAANIERIEPALWRRHPARSWSSWSAKTAARPARHSASGSPSSLRTMFVPSTIATIL